MEAAEPSQLPTLDDRTGAEPSSRAWKATRTWRNIDNMYLIREELMALAG